MIPEPLSSLLESYCMYEARERGWPRDLLAALARDPVLKAQFQMQLAKAMSKSAPDPEEFGRVVHQRGEFHSIEEVQNWLFKLWLDVFPDEKIDDFLPS